MELCLHIRFSAKSNGRMAIAGFDIACKSPAKNGCKAQSTGFVKKMSWLRNSVHFHYNVRVVRTTRIWDCKEHSVKGKTEGHSFLILISSHAWHVTSSHTPFEIMENQRESEPICETFLSLRPAARASCLPLHRGTAMGHCDFL